MQNAKEGQRELKKQMNEDYPPKLKEFWKKQDEEAMNRSEPHPWGVFLDARLKAIYWLESRGYDDLQIAVTLSMDETQVYRIRTSPINLEKCETSPNKNLP